MSENILVVEYEPRYIESVRHALAGQPFTAWFVKDGEEAMRALSAQPLKLIVLSSIIPKVSTADLIRTIRNRDDLKAIPILLTVSGYNGKTPRQDAVRLGASDILPKPFSESDFLGKVQQLLASVVDGHLTSSEIFGDLLADESVPHTQVKRPSHATGDIDKMLADTLGSVMPKKTVTSPGTTAVPYRPKTQTGTAELDKLVQDTLSGLERKKTKSQPIPEPVISPRMPTPPPDRIPLSYPVLTATPPDIKEDEEPVDGVRFGPYVLQEKIATGGMAEVWKARKRGEEGFQKTVAIKKILPHLSDNQDFIEMFIDEAKLAAQLNHNNIIHIYDLGKIASSYYIAMEFVDGHDLKTILRRAEECDQPLTVELALFIASKIAAALDYAHRKRDFDQKEMGLVHRDVSPQNVLISQEGDIKLCDFGIAKAASKASNTQAGALKGKLQYMAPEQAWGRNIDRRSDIFALGTVLFEMLTRKKLFAGDNEMSIIDQVREARVIPPSQLNDEVTAQVDAIVLKALEKDPETRYATAAEMAKDLESVLYNFRPTPTSADLAIYMHRLWSAEPVAAAPAPTVITDLPQVAPRRISPAAPPTIAAPIPAPVPVPVAPSAPAQPAVAMPAWDAAPAAAAAATKKRSNAIPLAFAGLLVAGVVGAFLYVYMQSPQAGSDGPLPAAVQPAPVSEATTATTAAIVAVPTSTTIAPVPQPPLLDPEAVADEVQRRLAAERARLEEQARLAQLQQQEQTATVAPPRPVTLVPQPQPQPPPQVVTQTTAPVPQPAQTQTAPAPAETVAPPVAEETATTAPAPQQPQFRQGDVVPPGTEGLVAPRVIRRGNVTYPPMARQQRVEGTVLLSVLVSETGEVLDVRVIRGERRPVGLNEAAIQSARRTTFSPPTINGVRVKAWTTVPVDFKL